MEEDERKREGKWRSIRWFTMPRQQTHSERQ